MEILALEIDAFDAHIPGEELAFEHGGLSAPEDHITVLLPRSIQCSKHWLNRRLASMRYWPSGAVISS